MKGFTILEICFVLVVMAILTSITVPSYERLARAAKESEAHAMLQAIAHAELRHQRSAGAYLACPAAGDVPRPSAPFPTADCWKTLGIMVGGAVRYRYGVELVGDSFIVTAEGDLDRDGTLSRLTLDGATLAIQTEGHLE